MNLIEDGSALPGTFFEPAGSGQAAEVDDAERQACLPDLLAFPDDILRCVALVHGLQHIVIAGFNADEDIVNAMLSDFPDILSALMEEVIDARVGGDAGLWKILLKKISELDKPAGRKAERITAGSPDSGGEGNFPGGFLKVFFHLLDGRHPERCVLVEIAECAAVVCASGGHFDEKTVSVSIGTDNGAVKFHGIPLNKYT